MEKKQIIEAMHNRLHEIDPHAKAILFGSRARGTEHEGSDWDVLILLDKPKVTLQDYDKYSYPLRELGWDIDEIINPVLFLQNYAKISRIAKNELFMSFSPQQR